ncbi:MAG: hypothetical protein ACI3V4_03560, partial [Faecousia sp.]
TPSHTHSWATEWSKNETHHWHECTADGCDVTENSEKNGYGEHDYTDDTDTTCNTCGYERTITPSHTHSWATEWSKNETHHWHECTADGCDVTENSGKDGYAVHTYDQEIATADYKAGDATCTAKATYYKSCVCGAKGTETFESGEVNTSNHTFGAWIDEVPATCKTTGTKGHKDCTGCNKHFDADGNEITDLTIPVDPANHEGTPGDWVKTDPDKHWKEYSCCSAKVEEGTHVYDDDTDTDCNTCGYTRTVEPPAPTDPSEPGSVPITPVKPGWISWLDKIFGDWWGDEEEKCDHVYTSVVTDPTCEEKGYTTHTCQKCGDTYKDSYTAPLGHKWDDGTVTKEATCTEDGEKILACETCGKTKTEKIDALGHTFEDGVCTQCGEKETSKPENPGKPSWDHIWDWIPRWWK